MAELGKDFLTDDADGTSTKRPKKTKTSTAENRQ
jgi:hypothetical protein